MAGLAIDTVHALLTPTQDAIYLVYRGGGSSIFQAQFCGFDEKKYPCQSTYLADKRFYWQHRKLKDFYLSVMRVTGHSLVAEITDRANVLRWGSQIGKMRPYLNPNAGHYQVLLLIKGEIKMVAPGELPKDSGWKLWWER